MASQTIPLITPSIAQWEEAGASLANALAKYLDLCTSLGTKSMEEGVQPNDLVERINSKLTSLHSAMDEQVAKARSILSETRNNFASPIYRIPDELITEMLTHVVYSPPNPFTHSAVVKMEDYLLRVYWRIYTLLGVCSRWQRIILGQGRFWNIIPIYRATKRGYDDACELYEKCRRATLASLERAQGRCLDIAAVLGPDFPGENFDILKEYLPRTRTINIVASKQSDIRHMMDTILQGSSSPSSLLELSIYQRQFDDELPEEHNLVNPPKSSNLTQFNALLRSIPVLRINSAHIRWDTLAFSDRLTKLRLQAINFGTDRAMIGCLNHALASATGLRELELVSIKSFYTSPPAAPISLPVAQISLYNLDSLLVDGLYFNTLLLVLKSIVPGQYRTNIHLTRHSRYLNELEGSSHRTNAFTSLLPQELNQRPVHKLCIYGAPKYTAEELQIFIESVPKLDTLLLDTTVFTTKHCRALTKPKIPFIGSPSDFPSFQHLRFSRSVISDITTFKSMVLSHSQSMKQLAFGGHIKALPNLGDYRSGRDEAKDKEIISQFKEIVPDFRLNGSYYIPLELQQDLWQLW